ncbi:Fic family protein [Flavobacterium sp. RHBU_3]|uniref:Fic family protein n=1 Tax=Flavobacterium sp. RHBU_3 TaxID=3391184 RepID=UPI0039852B6A
MTLQQVLQAHAVLIDKFGGSQGVRDMNGLDAALNRPFATFGGEDLYPAAVDKAAAVLESILINPIYRWK